MFVRVAVTTAAAAAAITTTFLVVAAVGLLLFCWPIFSVQPQLIGSIAAMFFFSQAGVDAWLRRSFKLA